MAILNFPADPQQDDQYTGSNGTTYIYDGVKWIGRASGTAGTNSIQNSGFVVQVDSDGDLVTPTFTIPNTAGTSGQVLKWPSSGSTLAWAADTSTTSRLVNGLKEAVLNSDGSITLPTMSTLDWDRRNLVGPTLQMGNDPTVSDVVITGPTPNLTNPNAVRLIIQGQEGFELPQAGGAEGGDVYIWAGHGGEGADYSGGGGDVKLRGGIGGLNGGYIRLESGNANAPNGNGGFLDLNAGDAPNTGGNGGNVNIRAGSGLLTSGTVNINTNNKQWVFSPDGSLTLPGALEYPNGALQRDTGNVICPGNASTVVFTATGVSVHTIRLLIQVEGTVGAAVDMDTQACEMIIAKSFRANALAASVYGVVHTSVAPLATFTANWNALTSRVEVLCTAPSANNVNVKIFATEITTSD
jgi:hypothetical protein